MGRIARRPLAWFYVVECGYAGNRPHLHALLANTSTLLTDQLLKAWHLGHSRIVVYNPTRGASHYLTKEILKNKVEYDISRRRAARL